MLPPTAGTIDFAETNVNSQLFTAGWGQAPALRRILCVLMTKTDSRNTGFFRRCRRLRRRFLCKKWKFWQKISEEENGGILYSVEIRMLDSLILCNIICQKGKDRGEDPTRDTTGKNQGLWLGKRWFFRGIPKKNGRLHLFRCAKKRRHNPGVLWIFSNPPRGVAEN